MLTLCTSIGVFQVISVLTHTLCFINRHLFRSAYNLYEIYGDKDSWIVITGGSDGIGLEISH